jgi:hypothetical protein
MAATAAITDRIRGNAGIGGHVADVRHTEAKNAPRADRQSSQPTAWRALRDVVCGSGAVRPTNWIIWRRIISA